MHYVLLTVGIGKHPEKLWCAITCLGKVPLILGHTWLQKHNPDIDWVTDKVNLTWFPPECKLLLETYFAKLLWKNESQETWVQALKAHESKVTIDGLTLEEAQKQVPKEYSSPKHFKLDSSGQSYPELGKVMGMGTHCGLWVWVQVGIQGLIAPFSLPNSSSLCIFI